MTLRSVLQLGQTHRSTAASETDTSLSQARHLNIIDSMKPLIVLLLLSIPAQAQTLAEIARRERERQSSLADIRVITNETAGTILPFPEPAQAAEPVSLPAAAEKPAADPAPADPARKYSEDLAGLRTKLLQLEDREVQLQLDLNETANRFLAPKTTEAARRRAQEAMGKTQNELAAVRSEIELTRKNIRLMEISGK